MVAGDALAEPHLIYEFGKDRVDLPLAAIANKFK
jgi:hypothetical protein